MLLILLRCPPETASQGGLQHQEQQHQVVSLPLPSPAHAAAAAGSSAAARRGRLLLPGAPAGALPPRQSRGHCPSGHVGQQMGAPAAQRTCLGLPHKLLAQGGPWAGLLLLLPMQAYSAAAGLLTCGACAPGALHVCWWRQTTPARWPPAAAAVSAAGGAGAAQAAACPSATAAGPAGMRLALSSAACPRSRGAH